MKVALHLTAILLGGGEIRIDITLPVDRRARLSGLIKMQRIYDPGGDDFYAVDLLRSENRKLRHEAVTHRYDLGEGQRAHNNPCHLLFGDAGRRGPGRLKPELHDQLACPVCEVRFLVQDFTRKHLLEQLVDDQPPLAPALNWSRWSSTGHLSEHQLGFSLRVVIYPAPFVPARRAPSDFRGSVDDRSCFFREALPGLLIVVLVDAGRRLVGISVEVENLELIKPEVDQPRPAVRAHRDIEPRQHQQLARAGSSHIPQAHAFAVLLGLLSTVHIGVARG